MNRRGFIGSIAALAVAPFIPKDFINSAPPVFTPEAVAIVEEEGLDSWTIGMMAYSYNSYYSIRPGMDFEIVGFKDEEEVDA